MGSCDATKLPQINFSGLEHGTSEWAAGQSQVVEALEEFGSFEVVCDDMLTPELREELFSKVIKEPFGLPVEAKLRNNSPDGSIQGYINNIAGMADYEGFLISVCEHPESVENFTNQMWGDEGNPRFRDTLSKFLSVLKEVDDMVLKMVFESYGVEKHLDSHLKAYEHCFRLARYGAPKSQQGVVRMGSHTDASMTTIVCQHEQEGLEIQLKDGSWTTPSQNSMIFLLGDYILPWSNGRLHPPYHRVKMAGSVERYTTVYTSAPNDETQIQAPKELVDDDHPLLFKPFYNKQYIGFRFSEPGIKAKCPLKDFCGTEVATDEQVKA